MGDDSRLRSLSDVSKKRLHAVFSALQKSVKPIQDDTQLDKLCSWLQTAVNDAESANELLAQDEVSNFLHHVSTEQLQEPFEQLIFALRMGSHLAVTAHRGTVQQAIQGDTGDECSSALTQNRKGFPPWIAAIFLRALQPDTWREGSVRNAWIQGLTTMCQTSAGVQWALTEGERGALVSCRCDAAAGGTLRNECSCYVICGFLLKSIDCIVDSSMFVTKQAHTLVMTVFPEITQLRHLHTQDAQVESELSRNAGIYIEKLLNIIRASLKYGKDHKTVLTSLQLVEEMGRSLSNFKTIEEDVLALSSESHIWCSRTLGPQLTATLVTLSCASDELRAKIEQLPRDLVSTQQVVPAMTLAARLLERSEGPLVHMWRDIVLLPVSMVTGTPIKSFDKTILQQMTNSLKEASVLRQLLLHSINLTSCWGKAGQLASAPRLIQCLRAVVGQVSTAQSDCSSPNVAVPASLQYDTKLLMALLEALIKYMECEPEVEPSVLMEVFDLCIKILEKGAQPVTLMSKAFLTVMLVLGELEHQPDAGCNPLSLPDGSADGHQGETLAELLLCSLCDVRWEARDTALETLTGLLKKAKPGGMLASWMLRHQMARQVWQSVSDGESYVRASAIKALAYLVSHERLWSQLTDFCSQEDIIRHLTSILSEDTEAFARRSTVALLCSWLSEPIFRDQHGAIRDAVNVSMSDLDWEVKLNVLQFWEVHIDGALSNVECGAVPAYASSLIGTKRQSSTEIAGNVKLVLSQLLSKGCLQCLLIGARDYDQSVRHRACQILNSVKDVCVKNRLIREHASTGLSAKRRRLQGNIANNDGANTTDKNVASNLIGTVPHASESVPTSTGCSNGDLKSAACESNLTDTDDCWGHLLHMKEDSSLRNLSADDFLVTLELMDLERLLKLTSESIDDYVRNPTSLFDDILTSLVKDDDENAVDCY